MNSRFRAAMLALSICLTTLALTAPAASADKYCLNSSSCSAALDNFPMTEDGLAAAIAKAAGHPGNDQIEIGAGTIEVSSGLTATSGPGNELQIQGVGNGNTFIHGTQPSGATLAMDLTGSGSDGITNVKFTLDGAQTGTRSALSQTAGRSTGLAFDVTSSGGNTSIGFSGSTGAECDYCDFKLSEDGAVGAKADHGGTFKASTFVDGGATPAQTVGLLATGADSSVVNVESAKFSKLKEAVTSGVGILNLRDSAIDLGTHPGAWGISVFNSNAGDDTLVANVDGVTVFGNGPTQLGTQVVGASLSPHVETATGSFRNSLFLLAGTDSTDFQCVQGANGVAAIDLKYVLKRNTGPAIGGACTSTGDHNVFSDGITPDQLFVSPGTGDLRLSPNATAVIDKGDPATSTAGRGGDAFNLTRFVDSSSSGNAVIDIGGSEYQSYQPDKPTIGSSTKIIDAGQSIDFYGSGIDGNGDPLTYAWDFGDGTQSTAQNPKHTYSQPGVFHVTLVTDDGSRSSESSDALTIQVLALSPPAGGGGAVAQPPTLVLGRQMGKASLKKMIGKPKIGEATAKVSGYLPITASAALDVKITLLRAKGGRVIGKARAFKIPAGTSGFTLGRQWGRYKLTPGKYRIQVTSSSLNDAPKAILNVIR